MQVPASPAVQQEEKKNVSGARSIACRVWLRHPTACHLSASLNASTAFNKMAPALTRARPPPRLQAAEPADEEPLQADPAPEAVDGEPHAPLALPTTCRAGFETPLMHSTSVSHVPHLHPPAVPVRAVEVPVRQRTGRAREGPPAARTFTLELPATPFHPPTAVPEGPPMTRPASTPMAVEVLASLCALGLEVPRGYGAGASSVSVFVCYGDGWQQQLGFGGSRREDKEGPFRFP